MHRVENLKSRVAKVYYELIKINDELESIEKNYLGLPEPKIIPFPVVDYKNNTPFLALPGLSLPSHIPDFRSCLQRDGLILLSWDKRLCEEGERFTAYWVTSTGQARFYASKLLSIDDFPMAIPDHKSYAAEDGIEFYGQEAPSYIVHAAPELMMSNPHHSSLRSVHVSRLKKNGSTVDFMYKYLLTKEKYRKTGT